MRTFAQKFYALLWCLKREPSGLSALQLHELTGIGYASLFLFLYKLEHDAKVRSEWVQGPKPRKRLYYATG